MPLPDIGRFLEVISDLDKRDEICCSWHRQTDELKTELHHKERRLESAIVRDINRGLTAVKNVTRDHSIQ